jgi:hypothetical protein
VLHLLHLLFQGQKGLLCCQLHALLAAYCHLQEVKLLVLLLLLLLLLRLLLCPMLVHCAHQAV